MRSGDPHRREILFVFGEGLARLFHLAAFRGGGETQFREAVAHRLFTGAPFDLAHLETALQALMGARQHHVEGASGAGRRLFEHPLVSPHRVLGATQDDLLGLLGEIVLLIHFLELIQLLLRIGERFGDLLHILTGATLLHGTVLVLEMDEILLGLHLVAHCFFERERRGFFDLVEFELGGREVEFLGRQGPLELGDLLGEILRLQLDDHLARLHRTTVGSGTNHRQVGPAFQIQFHRSLTRALHRAAYLHLLHEGLRFHRVGGSPRSRFRFRFDLGLFRNGLVFFGSDRRRLDRLLSPNRKNPGNQYHQEDKKSSQDHSLILVNYSEYQNYKSIAFLPPCEAGSWAPPQRISWRMSPGRITDRIETSASRS